MLKRYRYLLLVSTVTLFFVSNFGVFSLPVFAQESTTGFLCKADSPTDCKFDNLNKLIHDVLDYIFLYVIVPLATIAILYAGIMTLYESAQGKETTIYKKMIWNVILGMVFALGSYAIVKSLLLMLIEDSGPFYEAMQRVFK